MKKFALVLAAAAGLVMAPAVVQSTSAETYVRTSSSDWWGGSSAYRSRAQVVVAGSKCRMVTTKIKRNGKVIIRKVRKCG